ncbi:MAG: hypothetical protein IPM74_12020 [Crocinitomicaceae bacterium]|nr:hypothetical protein [Crocinitomicaceae bacterium]MBK8926600.1 hypothetical protein [Crocinitomicaceae bacterium]
MKYLSILSFIVISLTACQGNTDPGTTDSNENEEIARLKSENRLLQTQLNEKDSVLNEAIMLFNEIEQNLAMINLKDDEIRLRSTNVELAEDGKQWILQEIQNINYLREANGKKVEELNEMLKSDQLQIEQFQNMITNLMNQIQVQEEEIEMLRLELSDLDREYVELLEAYEEQTEITFATLQELNKAYYAYGTEEELIANGVLVKDGGFIGINKKVHLKDDFNDDYFTQIDLSKDKTIQVTGKEIRFITDHPSTAYSLQSNGNNHKIIIQDEKSFWKVSKYLVVLVE